MAFIEIKPKYAPRSGALIDDKIKVKFTPMTKAGNKGMVGTWKITITLGCLIVKKMGFVKNEKVTISMDEDNPFYLQIKKGTFGYSLSESGRHLGCTFKWEHKRPLNTILAFFANWDIVDGAIELKFCQEEIKEGRFL